MRSRTLYMTQRVRLFIFTLLLAATGCTRVPHYTITSTGGESGGKLIDRAPDSDRVRALATEIELLSPGNVSPEEAAEAARVSVYYSEQLAEYYDMLKWVEMHNVLVNLGLKRGGLCFQYAENLLAELEERKFQSLDLHRGIAWKGDLFDEHNCVILTARGDAFDTGIVLDAWRNAGHLRWAPVKKDYYPWVEKPAPIDEPTSLVHAAAHE